MGKSLKSMEKKAGKGANKRVQKENKQIESVEEAVGVGSSNKTSGERGDSSTENMALGKPVEEQSPISNLTIEFAPAAPCFNVDDSTKTYPPHEREVVVSANLILPKSKKITKSKVSGNRNISSEEILELSNIQPTTATTNNTGRANNRVVKVNHRKYTVKTPSNYLRKELKKYGFNFERYEGKGHNKRGTSIYLNLLLLELRIRKRERFPEFVENYKRELYRLIARQTQLQVLQGWTEKSEKYIEYFEKAIIAADKFARGNYYGSIKIYFGIGKEEFYLSEGVQFFIKRKNELRDETSMLDEDQYFDVLDLKD